jgi:beta-glucosidase
MEDQFSVRWTGIIVPKATGTYIFGGNVRLLIDGKTLDNKGIVLEKGKNYNLEASFAVAPYWWANAIEPSARLTWASTSRDLRKEALAAAQKADVIIFCGGITANLEGEEMPLEIDGFSHGDRTHINLPRIQEELLQELHKTGKPIVYINFSGSAMALNWESDNLPAIVQAFYPGEATGTALVNLLFGKVNPSGRLPVTFYKSVDDLPDFRDYTMDGRTYRYFKGEPLWGFGFGLSYTHYAYKNLRIPATIATGNELTLTVEVSNTGTMDGEEVVQVYVTDLEATVPVPLQSLAGFKRVLLKAGETRQVEITLKPEHFSLIDKNYNRVVEPGTFAISVGGKQPSVAALADGSVIRQEVKLTGMTFFIRD